MGRVVTVVAQDPQHAQHPNSENDPAIEGVMARLKPFDNPPAYRLLRAATLEELARQLKADLDAHDPPKLVQIIGHGAPGLLCLGASWTKRRAESATGPVYVLDSNPYWYGILTKCVRAPTKVELLGCDLADPTNTLSAEVADGPTLLFDLSRMWACEVSAPEEIIDPGQDFDAKGLYRHRRRLARAIDRSVAHPGQKPTGSRTTTPVLALTKPGPGAERLRTL